MKYLAMTMGAAASLAAVCGAARAEDLAPLAGRSVAVGEMSGIVYYRPTAAGFEVVTTLADGPAGRPVRFVTTLSPGQATTISVPGMSGEETTSITITRNGDHLSVDDRSAHAHGALVEAGPVAPRANAPE
jgi:hypothetical protein